MLNWTFGSPNRQQQEWLLLASASILKLMSGLSLSSPVFANYMRAAFGLSQTELDVAMTIQYCGMLVMVISGLMYDRWGARVTVAVGGVASTLASLAVTLAFAFPTALRGHAWALCLLLFVYGHSLSYAEVTAIAAAMSSFELKRLGRVMAVLGIFFSLGPALSALLHYLVFGNLSRPPDSQNAVGTIAVQTALVAIAHAFALVFIQQPILLSPGRQDAFVKLGEWTPILTGKDVTCNSDPESIEKQGTPDEKCEETTAEFLRATLAGFLSIPVMLLLMIFALTLGQIQAVLMNITTVTRSLGLSGEDVALFWVPIVLGIVWRIILGPLSDRFLSETCKHAAALFVCFAVFGCPALLLITLPMRPGVSPLGVTLSAYTLQCLLNASLFNLGPTLLSQICPQNLYGRLYGACLLSGTLLALPLTVQSGILYDRRATIVNGTVSCSGQRCYIYGNIANSACHLVAMALLLVLAALMHARSRS